MKTFMQEYGTLVVAMITIVSMIIVGVNFSAHSSEQTNQTFAAFDNITGDFLATAGDVSDENNNMVPGLSVPGLYASDGRLLVAYDDFVLNYGFNPEVDYVNNNYLVYTDPDQNVGGAVNNSWSAIVATFPEFQAVDVLVLPDGVTALGGRCFMNSQLREVRVPDTLESISYSCFYGSAIQKILLPEGVTSIGDSAFRNCERLSEFRYPTTVKTLGTYAFANCVCLDVDKVYVEGVVPSHAFDNCNSLRFVEFSDTITGIANYAFEFCDGLKAIYLPKSVKTIGYDSFYLGPAYSHVSPKVYMEGSSSINVYLGASNSGPATKYQNKTVEEYLSYVASFNEVENLKSYTPGVYDADMNLLDTWDVFVANTEFNVVADNSNAKLPFKNIVNYGHTASGISISKYRNIKVVVLPEGITEIGKDAFSNAPIKQVYIPDTVQKIRSGAFSSESILYVNLPKDVTIENHAFRGAGIFDIKATGSTMLSSFMFPNCYSLSNIEFSEQQTAIDFYYATYNCFCLNLVIPERVKEIKVGNEQYAGGEKVVNSISSIYFVNDQNWYTSKDATLVSGQKNVSELIARGNIVYRQ